MRIAIIGVGNLASALVQAISYVKSGGKVHTFIPALPFPKDLEVVGAFDIDRKKVGKKLREALFSPPNVAERFQDVDVDVEVMPGVLKDDLGFLTPVIDPVHTDEGKFLDSLKSLKPDVVVLSTSSNMNNSNTFYASAALGAGSALINTTPTPLVMSFGEKFRERSIPILGDDLLSQVGGTALHEGLVEFLESRGVRVVRSYQVDIAGTTEALVTLQDDVKDVKKGMKSSFIRGNRNVEVVAGTSDYVGFLKDRRVSYMVIEGIYGLNAKVRIDVSLKTSDPQNSVVPMLDLLKLAYHMKEKGIGGAVPEACGFYFKSPPVKYKSLSEAREKLLGFVSSL